MKIQIKDIELVFSENQQQFIDKIKMTIQNNYELILSCLGENKTFDISQDESNFNDTFYYIVKEVFNNDSNKQAFSDKDFLSAMYIEAMIRRNNITITKLNPNMSDEMLSSFIAYKYFELNGTFNDFVEYLKYRNKEEEIFQWLQNVSRWDTYNYLLNNISNSLKNDDEDYFKQINYIIYLFLKHSIAHNESNNYQNIQYPKISDKEFDSLFYNFLNYINAPIKWFNIYNDLKENKLIIVKTGNEDDISECFLDEDGIIKIAISNGDNLKGFYNFVHEFIHYIPTIDNNTFVNKISTLEFPSIFFEKILAEFLKEKGFSTKLIEKIANDRKENNYFLCSTLFPLLLALNRYINYGELTEHDMISFYLKLIDISNPKDSKEIIVDLEKKVNAECDSLINLLLNNELLVKNVYQYLIGSYLAELVFNKMNDDNTIIQKMIYITNNLQNISTKNILELFDIKNFSQEETVKKLEKK